MKVLEPQVFANGSATLPKAVCDALGVKAGDTVGFVMPENGVYIEQAHSVSETADVLARCGQH